MRQLKRVAVAAWVATWPAAAQQLDSPLVALTPSEALRDGTPILLLRPRFTWVDPDVRPDHTSWGSLRTQFGWQTLEYRGVKLTAELIDVRRFGSHNIVDYRSAPAYASGSVAYAAGAPAYGAYGPGYYPRVADPQATDINRLHLDYVGWPGTTVRLGRQAVRMDNQRFLGDYDFGQMPQLLDGVNVTTVALPRTQASYGYFWRVRNAYDVQWKTSINAATVHVDVVPTRLKLGAYALLQNQARTGSVTGFADNSNRILGGRAWGTVALTDRLSLDYVGESAQQRDFAGGDSRIRASYYRVGGGASIAQGFVRVDWERLTSNRGQYGFQTPLGSTQMFLGRVDVFASTPPQGLEDLRATLGAQVWRVSAQLAYHRFHSDYNDWDLGHEWDIALDFAFARQLHTSAVYGDYRAGGPQYGFPNTRKLWLTLTYEY